MNGMKTNGTMTNGTTTNGTTTNGANINGHEVSDNQASLPGIVAKLKRDVDVLSEFYSSSAHPAPSFDQNAPTASVPKDAPLEVKAASDTVMDNALKLFDLCSGPTKILSHLTVAVNLFATTSILVLQKS